MVFSKMGKLEKTIILHTKNTKKNTRCVLFKFWNIVEVLKHRKKKWREYIFPKERLGVYYLRPKTT
jgi:hypothetical protein